MGLIPADIDEIRVAVVGMGKMGNAHLLGLRELCAGKCEDYYKGNVCELAHRLKICGLCDRSWSSRLSYKDYNLFTSPEVLIREARPHLAVISTPTKTHFELAEQCLSHGIHTLVEKPVTTTCAELRFLLDLAEQRECRLMAGHVERYNPVSIKLVSLLSPLRPPFAYSFIRTQKRPERIPDDIVTDKIIHDLDLSLCFFGPVKDVVLVDVKKVDNLICEACVELSHENGSCGTVLVSWLVERDVVRRRVCIENRDHSFEGDFSRKRLFVDGQETSCAVEGMSRPANNQIKDELVDFLAYSSEWPGPGPRFAPLLSVEEIIQVAELIEKINTG